MYNGCHIGDSFLSAIEGEKERKGGGGWGVRRAVGGGGGGV